MNSSQVAAARRLTDRIETFHYMSSQGSYVDGPIVYTMEPCHDGYLLFASNVSSEMRWFHRGFHFGAFIGPRGGVKVHGAMGYCADVIAQPYRRF